MPRDERLLTAGQVVEVTGLRYPTLDRWFRPERGGFLECAQPAAGKDTRRGFSFLDVLRIEAVKRLRGTGVSMQMIRRVLGELGERYAEDDPLLAGRLVVAGTRLFWAIDDATLLDVLAQQLAAAPLVILPIGDMIKATRAKVEALCTDESAHAAAYHNNAPGYGGHKCQAARGANASGGGDW